VSHPFRLAGANRGPSPLPVSAPPAPISISARVTQAGSSERSTFFNSPAPMRGPATIVAVVTVRSRPRYTGAFPSGWPGNINENGEVAAVPPEIRLQNPLASRPFQDCLSP
jgi:hypothetical protein